VGGMAVFLRAVETGFAVVPVPHFDPALVAATIDDTGTTAASLVPTMLHRLLEAGWRGAPSLRFVLLGGAPCPEALMNEARTRGIPIAPTYGLTETASHVATLPPWEAPQHIGTVGKPVPGATVRIGESPEGPAPRGAPGRIWVSGPTVSPSARSASSLADWLRTDDLGCLDEAGYLTVLGRIDDVIVTGGEKVAPREVEGTLAAHPSVGEAVVVGVPDSEWGQRAVAVVTPTSPRAPGIRPDPASLRAWLKRSLAPHKVPRQIVVLDDLPRTEPGKPDRNALREMLEGDPDG